MISKTKFSKQVARQALSDEVILKLNGSESKFSSTLLNEGVINAISPDMNSETFEELIADNEEVLENALNLAINVVNANSSYGAGANSASAIFNVVDAKIYSACLKKVIKNIRSKASPNKDSEGEGEAQGDSLSTSQIENLLVPTLLFYALRMPVNSSGKTLIELVAEEGIDVNDNSVNLNEELFYDVRELAKIRDKFSQIKYGEVIENLVTVSIDEELRLDFDPIDDVTKSKLLKEIRSVILNKSPVLNDVIKAGGDVGANAERELNDTVANSLASALYQYKKSLSNLLNRLSHNSVVETELYTNMSGKTASLVKDFLVSQTNFAVKSTKVNDFLKRYDLIQDPTKLSVNDIVWYTCVSKNFREENSANVWPSLDVSKLVSKISDLLPIVLDSEDVSLKDKRKINFCLHMVVYITTLTDVFKEGTINKAAGDRLKALSRNLLVSETISSTNKAIETINQYGNVSLKNLYNAAYGKFFNKRLRDLNLNLKKSLNESFKTFLKRKKGSGNVIQSSLHTNYVSLMDLVKNYSQTLRSVYTLVTSDYMYKEYFSKFFLIMERLSRLYEGDLNQFANFTNDYVKELFAGYEAIAELNPFAKVADIDVFFPSLEYAYDPFTGKTNFKQGNEEYSIRRMEGVEAITVLDSLNEALHILDTALARREDFWTYAKDFKAFFETSFVNSDNFDLPVSAIIANRTVKTGGLVHTIPALKYISVNVPKRIESFEFEAKIDSNEAINSIDDKSISEHWKKLHLTNNVQEIGDGELNLERKEHVFDPSFGTKMVADSWEEITKVVNATGTKGLLPADVTFWNSANVLVDFSDDAKRIVRSFANDKLHSFEMKITDTGVSLNLVDTVLRVIPDTSLKGKFVSHLRDYSKESLLSEISFRSEEFPIFRLSEDEDYLKFLMSFIMPAYHKGKHFSKVVDHSVLESSVTTFDSNLIEQGKLSFLNVENFIQNKAQTKEHVIFDAAEDDIDDITYYTESNLIEKQALTYDSFLGISNFKPSRIELTEIKKSLKDLSLETIPHVLRAKLPENILWVSKYVGYSSKDELEEALFNYETLASSDKGFKASDEKEVQNFTELLDSLLKYTVSKPKNYEVSEKYCPVNGLPYENLTSINNVIQALKGNDSDVEYRILRLKTKFATELGVKRFLVVLTKKDTKFFSNANYCILTIDLLNFKVASVKKDGLIKIRELYYPDSGKARKTQAYFKVYDGNDSSRSVSVNYHLISSINFKFDNEIYKFEFKPSSVNSQYALSAYSLKDIILAKVLAYYNLNKINPKGEVTKSLKYELLGFLALAEYYNLYAGHKFFQYELKSEKISDYNDFRELVRKVLNGTDPQDILANSEFENIISYTEVVAKNDLCEYVLGNLGYGQKFDDVDRTFIDHYFWAALIPELKVDALQYFIPDDVGQSLVNLNKSWFVRKLKSSATTEFVVDLTGDDATSEESSGEIEVLTSNEETVNDEATESISWTENAREDFEFFQKHSLSESFICETMNQNLKGHIAGGFDVSYLSKKWKDFYANHLFEAAFLETKGSLELIEEIPAENGGLNIVSGKMINKLFKQSLDGSLNYLLIKGRVEEADSEEASAEKAEVAESDTDVNLNADQNL